MKKCARCKIEKSSENFTAHKSYCRDCVRQMSYERYQKNRKIYPPIENLENEQWVFIAASENKYQISNAGRVKRVGYFVTKKDASKCFHQEQLLKQVENMGYLYVSLYINGQAKSYKVHRLVASHFIANENNLPQVNHIDGNKHNNNMRNLEWCTNKQNCDHARRMGKMPCKLRPEQVLEIYKSPLPIKQIADRYNISQSSIQEIKNGKSWSWVTGAKRINLKTKKAA